MSSIFISHSHRDRAFAISLADKLRAAGLRVWVDEAELQVGDSLLSKIADGIRDADYLAVVLSQSSVSSEWVRK